MDLTGLGRAVVDTSCCIHNLDRPADDERRHRLQPLMAAAEARKVDLVVSTVTAMELLVRPLREGNRTAEAAVRLFLDELCRPVPVGSAVGRRWRTPPRVFAPSTACRPRCGHLRHWYHRSS